MTSDEPTTGILSITPDGIATVHQLPYTERQIFDLIRKLVGGDVERYRVADKWWVWCNADPFAHDLVPNKPLTKVLSRYGTLAQDFPGAVVLTSDAEEWETASLTADQITAFKSILEA